MNNSVERWAMSFTLEEAVKTANWAVSARLNRSLTDVEIIVLRGAWYRQDYDQIAAQSQYATSYISQDVAPKLWKALTVALGEKVKKSNFKEPLKRFWEKHLLGEEMAFDSSRAVLDSKPHAGNFLPPVGARSAQKLEEHSDSKICYVERPPTELNCYETLRQPGALVRVKAPSLMGKTLLMARTLARLKASGYRTVSLSFELADRRTHFTDLDKFLRWFCFNVARELKLPTNQMDEYWYEEEVGSKVSCSIYFEEYLLVQEDRPLVLCLDDVDLLFPHPEIYEDFFGLLRSWYEKARSREEWKKLRLAIVHSTDAYIRLNINQSPFNVGMPIELSEFTPEQVEELARQHGITAHAEQIGAQGFVPLMEMVGGHPYLLEQTFAYLKTHPNVTLAQLLTMAPTEAGIYANHLRERWLNLQGNYQLAAAYKSVVNAQTPVPLEPVQAHQLQSMGLVKLQGNEAEPRCCLYRQYFQAMLGK